MAPVRPPLCACFWDSSVPRAAAARCWASLRANRRRWPVQDLFLQDAVAGDLPGSLRAFGVSAGVHSQPAHSLAGRTAHRLAAALVFAKSAGDFLVHPGGMGAFGVLLAVLSRGAALAIGLGIIYGLVLEGIITAFGRQVDLLDQVSKAFLRTNGYSLISSLGVSLPTESGPGGFIGPTVSGTQAFLVLGGYILLFVMISAAVIRRRDVSGSG